MKLKKSYKVFKVSKKVKRDVDTNNLFDYGVDEKSRTILLYGEIDDNPTYMFECAMTLLEGLSKDPINIRLNTIGGSIMVGNSIVDRILSPSCETHIHASGEVASMGVFILASGDYRTASSLTAFMHHEDAYEAEGRHSHNKNYIKFAERQDLIMCQWLATRTNKDAKFWKTTGVELDHWFTVKEALEYGLIHEVVN